MSWGPPGTGPTAQKWYEARQVVTNLSQELDRLEAALRHAGRHVNRASDEAQLASRRRATERGTACQRLVLARMHQTLGEVNAVPQPPGRAGVAALGSLPTTPPSSVAPGLLRIGTARHREPYPDAPAYLAGVRNVEIRPASTHGPAAEGLLWTVVLRRLLDVSPALHRVVVFDATTMKPELIELAALRTGTADEVVTFLFREDEMWTELDRLTRAAHRSYVDVLRSSERTIVEHNARAAPHDRLPFVTIVLPSGFAGLSRRVIDALVKLAHDGPQTGASVIARIPPGRTDDRLHDAVLVRLEAPSASVTDGDFRVVEDLQLDPRPSPSDQLTAVRSIAAAAQGPRPSGLTSEAPTRPSPDLWSTYVSGMRSLHAHLQYDTEQRAASDEILVNEIAATIATSNHRHYLLRHLETRTRIVRKAMQGLAADLGFTLPTGPTAKVSDEPDVERVLARLAADVERVETMLERANDAKQEAAAEAALERERQAWLAEDNARRHDLLLAAAAIGIPSFFACAVCAIVVRSLSSFFTGLLVTSVFVGFSLALLLLTDATRAVLFVTRVWPTAYHPHDRHHDQHHGRPPQADALRPVIAAAAVGSAAVLGVMVGVTAAGHPGRAVIVGLFLAGALAWPLYRSATNAVQVLRHRAKRFTAPRPDMAGRAGQPPSRPSSPPG